LRLGDGHAEQVAAQRHRDALANGQRTFADTTIGSGHGYRAPQVVLAINELATGKQCRIAEPEVRFDDVDVRARCLVVVIGIGLNFGVYEPNGHRGLRCGGGGHKILPGTVGAVPGLLD
jgi:hypothetical protein